MGLVDLVDVDLAQRYANGRRNSFFFLTYADIENNRNVRNIILLYSILIL